MLPEVQSIKVLLDVPEERFLFPWHVPPGSKIKASPDPSPTWNKTDKNGDTDVSEREIERACILLPQKGNGSRGCPGRAGQGHWAPPRDPGLSTVGKQHKGPGAAQKF